MGLLFNTINKLLDLIDPPTPVVIIKAPCPGCKSDLSRECVKCGSGKGDLMYYLCKCGHASAWFWQEGRANLIYGEEPGFYDDE